jgi:uncharacterized protein (DUF983 family)
MTKPTRLPLSTALGRAWRLRCPRCGGGKLFAGWFRMYEHCPSCKLKYERDPGYFLGSAYVNYGLTALVITVSYVLGRFAFDVESRVLLPPLAVFCLVFPLVFFRYARAVWLAVDIVCDPVEDDFHPSEPET